MNLWGYFLVRSEAEEVELTTNWSTGPMLIIFHLDFIQYFQNLWPQDGEPAVQTGGQGSCTTQVQEANQSSTGGVLFFTANQPLVFF